MELNNLLSNLRKQNSDTPKYIAIEIAPDSIKTAIWEVVGTEAKLIQIGTTEETEPTNSEKLLQAVDLSLSTATEGVTPEPNDVVFSLPDAWVTPEGIADDKKPLLRHLSNKLDLNPIGFVVTTEALVNYLEIKRGNPPNCILLGISNDEVSVTIISNGKIIDSHLVGRSDDLGSDVEEGIARFGDINNLPANILLFDGTNDLENLKQVLTSYNWQERLPFLHLPKIEILNNQETIKAIVTAGGGEVIKNLEVGGTSTTEDTSEDSPTPTSAEPTEIPDLQEEFGFKVSHIDESNSESEDSSLEEDGDSEPEDTNITPVEDSFQTELDQEEREDEMDDSSDTDDEDVESEDKPKKRLPLPSLAFLRKPFSGSASISHKSRLPIFLIMGLIILSLFGAGASAAYWYLPKATVTIYLEPKTIQRDLTFSIDSQIDQIDLSNQKIPGRVVQTQVEGQKTQPATGDKLVGEKATGTVTIYNRTNSEKTLAAGTTITGPDSLKYTLDKEVNIASASTKENPDFSITTEPSTVDVTVTAATIGAQYNLGTGTEFSVSNFDKSSFVAKAKNDLNGGTSREITAVSAADIKTVTNELRKELEQKITTQLNQNSTDFLQAIILPDQEENFETDYSATEGQEASEVTLHATLTVDTLTYKKSDLDILIEQSVQESVPEGFKLDPSRSTTEVIDVDTTDSESVLTKTKVEAKILPQLNSQDISRNIRGKYPQVTESYFRGLPGFSKVEIDIQPPLPPRLKTFPRITNNIQVEFKTTN